VRPELVGGYIEEVNRTSIYSKTLTALHAYDQLMSNSIGKKRSLFKMSDTGAREINASLKWSFALSYVSGCPFGSVGVDRFCEFDFKPHLTCAYFGAAGNRARQAFENRFRVSAFDKKEPIVYNAKMTVEVLKEFRMMNWAEQDVLLYTRHHEFDVFASDVYMKQWQRNGRDPRGHKYVSAILRGKLVDVDTELPQLLPKIRFVKGFIPEPEHLPLYGRCYPFVLFNVCRPVTTEIIFLKTNDLSNKSFDLVAAMMTKAYGFDVSNPEIRKEDEDYKGPVRYVRWPEMTYVESEQQFAEVCRQLMIARCQETNWLLRKLAIDIEECIGSPHNRRIWLYHKDMPNLHVMKKFALTETESVSMYSATFGAMFGIDDVVDDDVKDDTVPDKGQDEKLPSEGPPPGKVNRIQLDELKDDSPMERKAKN